MDQFFDEKSAANALEQISREVCDQDERTLGDFCKIKLALKNLEVIEMDGPKTWRLVKKNPDSAASSVEEAVFTVRGVICAKELPPLYEKPSNQPARYKYLRQGVSITGLGINIFDDVINSVQEIYDMYHRRFPQGRLESIKIGQYNEYLSLEASNRYFTPKRDAKNMTHIPFDRLVDPQGILENMASAGYIHGEENIVRYYVRRIEDDGTHSFVTESPQILRVGDIVELQVSFVIVPLKGNTAKLQTILHSVVMLDDQFSKDAQIKRQKAELEKMTKKITCHVGYMTLAPRGAASTKNRQSTVIVDMEVE